MPLRLHSRFDLNRGDYTRHSATATSRRCNLSGQQLNVGAFQPLPGRSRRRHGGGDLTARGGSASTTLNSEL
jgi:hypothetical protein